MGRIFLHRPSVSFDGVLWPTRLSKEIGKIVLHAGIIGLRSRCPLKKLERFLGPAGLLLLVVAFACLLVFDSQASRKAQAPAWYPRLRLPLTAVVVVSLMLGALA